jgi:hypothetical protein
MIYVIQIQLHIGAVELHRKKEIFIAWNEAERFR